MATKCSRMSGKLRNPAARFAKGKSYGLARRRIQPQRCRRAARFELQVSLWQSPQAVCRALRFV